MNNLTNITLVYIDDHIDFNLMYYLDTRLKESIGDNISLQIIEFEFKDYETTIHSKEIIESNVILIDSRLFEDAKAQNGKFTGEQFKLILKKLFPFIEVIVITSKDNISDLTVKKCSDSRKDALVYYDKELKPVIEKAINNIIDFQKIAITLNNNNEFNDKCLLDKINNSLRGEDIYDDLKKEDIDNLIADFKTIQERLDV